MEKETKIYNNIIEWCETADNVDMRTCYTYCKGYLDALTEEGIIDFLQNLRIERKVYDALMEMYK